MIITKPIPELAEDLKKIEETVTAIGQVVSVARPYNALDMHFIQVERDSVQAKIDQITIDIFEAADYTRKAVKNSPSLELHNEAMHVYLALKELTDKIAKLAERANSYLILIDTHP